MICLALENPDPAWPAAVEQELGLACIATQCFQELLELLIQERLTGFAVDVRMLERADQALYEAKRAGKNCIRGDGSTPSGAGTARVDA